MILTRCLRQVAAGSCLRYAIEQRISPEYEAVAWYMLGPLLVLAK